MRKNKGSNFQSGVGWGKKGPMELRPRPLDLPGGRCPTTHSKGFCKAGILASKQGTLSSFAVTSKGMQ